MDKSKLTIQRPKGCPEWAEIGVMVMVRDKKSEPWKGPYPLLGYDPNLVYEFCVQESENSVGFREARPYIKWQPEPGEWVIFWSDSDDNGYMVLGQYDALVGSYYARKNGLSYRHVARLVDDDGNLIDLRCSVEELKERTEWL